jgi:cytochrome c553
MAQKMPLLTLALAALLAALPSQAKAPRFPETVSVDLPDGLTLYPEPGADAINDNCLACHSRDMVLNQPNMPKAAWEAEIAKMRNVFKAPVAESDVPAILDYLVRVKGTK